MAIKLEFTDNTRKTVPPSTAFTLRAAWATRHHGTLSAEQVAYLDTIKRIIYSPDDFFCFCRYELTKTVPMRLNQLYVYTCTTCKQRYTTDVKK